MERKPIKNKIITKIINNELNENLIFSRLTIDFSTNEVDYTEELIEDLRQANSINIFLTSTDLPEVIFEELKWFKYYGFNTKVIINDESLKPFYKPIAGNYLLQQDVIGNKIEIVFEGDKRHIYLLDDFVKKMIPFNNILDREIETNSVIYAHKNDFSNLDLGGKIEKFTNLEIITNSNEYIEWSNRNQLTKILYIENLNHDIKELIYLNGVLYRLTVFGEAVYLSAYDLGNIDIYTNLSSLDNYYIYKNGKFVLRNKEIFNIKIIEKKMSFEDYEKEVIYTDLSEEIKKYYEYSNIEFKIFIEPPYIQNLSNFKRDNRYDQIKSKLSCFKKSITLLDEILDFNNFSGDLGDTLNYIRNFIITKNNIKEETVSLISAIKRIESYDKFKKLLRQYYLQKELEKSNKMNSSIINLKEEIDKLEKKLTIAQSNVEINNINERLIDLNNLKQNIKSKAKSKIDYEKIFDDYVERRKAIIQSRPKSLNRIIKINDSSAKESMQYHLLNQLLQILQIVKQLIDFYTELLEYEIPKIGLLYDDGEEKLLVISYEEELAEAKIIAGKENLKIYIDKGE